MKVTNQRSPLPKIETRQGKGGFVAWAYVDANNQIYAFGNSKAKAVRSLKKYLSIGSTQKAMNCFISKPLGEPWRERTRQSSPQ